MATRSIRCRFPSNHNSDHLLTSVHGRSLCTEVGALHGVEFVYGVDEGAPLRRAAAARRHRLGRPLVRRVRHQHVLDVLEPVLHVERALVHALTAHTRVRVHGT